MPESKYLQQPIGTHQRQQMWGMASLIDASLIDSSIVPQV